ncbi:MAG: hypothetical protein EOO27_48010 [Comamonadaceae bacterium]|nr:MAG: hypothetical protein EOO27_48010 [Comamonadaceae bacterium]
MPVQLVLTEVVRGEQMSHPVRTDVDRPTLTSRLAARIHVSAATLAHCRPGWDCRFSGPNSSRQKSNLWLNVIGDDLAVGDGVQGLDPSLLTSYSESSDL